MDPTELALTRPGGQRVTFSDYVRADTFLQRVKVFGDPLPAWVHRTPLRSTAHLIWAHRYFSKLPAGDVETEFACCAEIRAPRIVVTETDIVVHSLSWYTSMAPRHGYRMHRCLNFHSPAEPMINLIEFHQQKEP